MSRRERVLPQWLVDLPSGNTRVKNTDSLKTRGSACKKKVNVLCVNDYYSDAVINERNMPSTSGRASAECVGKPKVNGFKKQISPRKNKPNCLEMSDSEEEVDAEPNHATSNTEENESKSTLVDKEDVNLTSLKELDDSDATDFEFDVNDKENLQDSLCNEEPDKYNAVASASVVNKNNTSDGYSAEVDVDTMAGFTRDASSDKGANVCNTIGNSAIDTGCINNADTGVDININVEASDEADKTSVHNNTSITDNTTNNSSQIFRSKCKYGTQCFRKNSQHRLDFSHPGDVDFTAVDNRPECEYGLSCYRKNPLHRQHYKHTKKMQKPRQAKRPRKKLTEDSASEDEDDYDLEDSFIDDGSSDDYRPSNSDSETDFDGELEEEETKSGDDTKQKKRDSRKLKRKYQH